MFNDPPKAPTLLIEQHEAAALEFGKAAHDVDDCEALRVLALLEQHHNRLASIIKTQIAPPEAIPEEPKANISTTKAEPSTIARDVIKPVAGSTAGRVPSPVRSRRPPRDISSSIASNLANARGIPSQDGQSRPRQLSPTKPTSRNSQPSPRVQSQPEAQHARQFVPKEPASTQLVEVQKSQRTLPTTSEDSFQKFYSTFENIFSKISAPLAFAGLPLQPEEPATTAAPTPLSARTTATSDDPAISRLFSRAALRAVKDNQSSAGVHDSFYVVPTSGGTVSYAGMLSSQQKPPTRHVRTTSGASETQDHYVDAHETQDRRGGSSSQSKPVSASGRRSGSSAAQNPTSNAAPKKTLEELELENASLKQLTDRLSHRLYDWEKNAQNQSIALQASIRTLQGPGAPSGSSRRGTHDTQMAPLVEEEEEEEARAVLEAALAHAQKDVERYGRENEKLKTVVLRYRERWEKLKEGARVRREGAERDRERKGEEEEVKEDE